MLSPYIPKPRKRQNRSLRTLVPNPSPQPPAPPTPPAVVNVLHVEALDETRAQWVFDSFVLEVGINCPQLKVIDPDGVPHAPVSVSVSGDTWINAQYEGVSFGVGNDYLYLADQAPEGLLFEAGALAIPQTGPVNVTP